MLLLNDRFFGGFPKGSTYTTIREFGSIVPSIVWYFGPNSQIVVHMDPLGFPVFRSLSRLHVCLASSPEVSRLWHAVRALQNV